ncbi:hypothetical protein [Evansella clarkii]
MKKDEPVTIFFRCSKNMCGHQYTAAPFFHFQHPVQK